MITVRSSTFGESKLELGQAVVMQIHGYTMVRPHADYDPLAVIAWLDAGEGDGDLYITQDGRFLFSDRHAAMIFKLRFG